MIYNEKSLFLPKNEFMRKIYSIILVLSCLILTNCKSNDDGPTTFLLADVTAELLNFTYTPNTGNSTSRLEYQIRFRNPNNIIIRGFYRVTTSIDGTETTLLSTDESPCYEIAANSTCIFNFDEVTTHLNGVPTNIEFVSVEYNIE